MKLIVCALADLQRVYDVRRPAGVISLLSPHQVTPDLSDDPPRLVHRFNDIAEPMEGMIAPTPDMVADLLTFAGAFPDQATLLLHCWMGVSRSPAAAFILACAFSEEGREARIAAALRQASPSATPSPFLVRLADEQLGRNGRMEAAIHAIGRGREASSGDPFELETSGWGA